MLSPDQRQRASFGNAQATTVATLGLNPSRGAAGCVCAENLCEGYDGKGRETRLINRPKRKSNWLRRKWRRSDKGNQFLNIEDNNVGVNPDIYRPGKWGWRIGSEFSKHRYDTDDAAKLALFDELAERLNW